MISSRLPKNFQKTTYYLKFNYINIFIFHKYKYCEIKEKIIAYNDISVLKFPCSSCNKINHFIFECPDLVYQPQKNKVIQTYLQNNAQKRKSFQRNKNRHKFKSLMIKKEIEFSNENSKFSPIFANSEVKQTKFFNDKEIENIFNCLKHSKSNPISLLFDEYTFPRESPFNNDDKFFPVCLEENEDEKLDHPKIYSDSIETSK